VRVWGIASDDNEDVLNRFRDTLGITFPILYDETGEVHAQWLQDTAFPTAAFPQDWLVDPNGLVAYSNSSYEPDEIRALLNSWLSDD
jgi:peroxiredoxin